MSRAVSLVMLASGDSRRFDGNKLLCPFHGKPMYRHLADRALSLRGIVFDRICLVSQYGEILRDMAAAGCLTVKNDRSDLGISHSIRLGIALTDEDSDLCFAVCDQPWLRAETLAAFITGWRQSGKGLGCLGAEIPDGGLRLGNPAVFSRAYRGKLLALNGDVGGRAVIKKHPEDLFVFRVSDPRELFDVDTREALGCLHF